MNLFDYTDYKLYVMERVRSLPRRGRGELGKIALALRVHPTLISQVFRGQRDLSLEQAALLAAYFQLSQPEREFFIDLVCLNRAGNEPLRDVLKKRMSFLKTLEVKPSSPEICQTTDREEGT